MHSKSYFPIAKNLRQAIGVAYDGHYIYWTDIYSERESIVRSLENGENKEVSIFTIFLYIYSVSEYFTKYRPNFLYNFFIEKLAYVFRLYSYNY